MALGALGLLIGSNMVGIRVYPSLVTIVYQPMFKDLS